MTETTTRTGFIHPADEPIINVEVLESLIAWRNWMYWQELEEQKLRRQQLADDVRETVEEEQRR